MHPVHVYRVREDGTHEALRDDPTLPAARGHAAGRPPSGDPVGDGRTHQAPSAHVAVPRGSSSITTELRRKIAWAVGSAYAIKYLNYDTWPAQYARLAADRLIAIHGEPGHVEGVRALGLQVGCGVPPSSYRRGQMICTPISPPSPTRPTRAAPP